eukprot:g26813.t1
MSAAALKEEGNSKFKQGDFAGAVKAYTESLALDPEQHLCYSNRSAAHLKLGDAQEALADAERCLRLASDFPKGYSRQAAALQELERWDEAVAICERGIAKCAKDDADSLRKTLAEVKNRQLTAQLQGCWHGKVTEALGGYDQEMEFLDHYQVRLQVLGRSIQGRYRVDAMQNPMHLDIQVAMEGMPSDAPPVPYITKVDEHGMHLCCPYMKMERPERFAGEGYCLMTKGAMAQSVEEKVDHLSKEEKVLLCAREVIEALPNRRLDEPNSFDTEEETRDKIMAQVKFETSIFKVQQRFGEEMIKEVLDSAKMGGAPPGLAGTAELDELKVKLEIMEGLAQPPKPPPASKPATSPASPAKPRPASPTAGGGGEVLFEILSAYGTCGLSLGYENQTFSFSGVWSDASQMLLVATMILGRLRGLPDSIDASVRMAMPTSDDQEWDGGR